MSAELAAPPVLSTPEDHIFEAPATELVKSTLTEEEVKATYEIERTATEIVQGGWTQVALQFPDHMLVDAPRVVEILGQELEARDEAKTKRKISILADTSYSACCVDEVAAEHTAADVVVHYGRTCLSPTSRLPVIYVYTSHKLDHNALIAEFTKEFPDKAGTKAVVMADLTYQSHVEDITKRLKELGYENIIATEATRDPAGTIPNRKLSGVQLEADELKSYALFHIADPPKSLLLALQSRFASLHILSIPSPSSPSLSNPTFRTAGLLRRRFAKVLSLASSGVVGILVNTLSISNYLSSIDLLRKKIDKAGKKSYTVVVGKLNPAKLANFSEIEGWVVIGCWESGLIEDDAEYWRPVVTPFEMEVALMREEDRVWGDEWWGGIEKLKIDDAEAKGTAHDEAATGTENGQADEVDEDESMPPEFDLRTGRLVSHSRPMMVSRKLPPAERGTEAIEGNKASPGGSLMKRGTGELASVNGVFSPGAEYLRTQRTWQGLGTDFDEDASTLIEEGRSGIARGYKVGDDEKKH
ncbi:Diphthamide biosynthesis protein 2 [Lecanicillium sp. MT-2017a]|nr:Diphthamide biosynthesis protein 2 [Lecanicillium sp. MT-2017a]